MRETFRLTHTKIFRHALKLYVKFGDKTETRNCEFTTAHLVTDKERNKGARKKHAEFSTSDEAIIDALYRDTGYGKVFVHKDDPKGERKRTPFKLTPTDKSKLALENLFRMAGLEFDPSKDTEVLEKEYQIHMTATSGKVIQQGVAKEIAHKPVNVSDQLLQAVEAGKNAYVEKFGKPFPEFDSKEDMYGLIDGLAANPDFDAESYIASKLGSDDSSDIDQGGDDLPNTVEELQTLYQQVLGKQPANLKKNDIGWLKEKIKESQANK